MRGESCSEDRGFESMPHKLGGHFSNLFVVKIVMLVTKDENKHKRGRGWTIFYKRGQKISNSWVFKLQLLLEIFTISCDYYDFW